MSTDIELSEDLKLRVAAIAARSSLSPAEIIADALENGHSLEWQEQFLEKVAQGVVDADQNNFAGDAELRLVINKYRPI